MHRRRLLALGVAGSVSALAGCGEGADEQTPTPAAAEQTTYEDALRDALTREGIEIRGITYDDGRVLLEYEPPEPTEESVEQSIAVTARAYYDRVHGGWSAERLDASVFVDGELVATWHMDSEWIHAYLEGSITRDELGRRVEESVERHDGEKSDDGVGSDDGDGTAVNTETRGDEGTAGAPGTETDRGD